MNKKINIDFSAIENNQDFYNALKKQLQLPEYFGDNLDALYDTLTGFIELPLEIGISNLDEAKKASFADLLATLEDAAENTNNDLKIKYYEMPIKEITWDEYLAYFKSIVDKTNTPEMYNDAEYYEYTKLNWSRTNRWLKTNPVVIEVQEKIASIGLPMHWKVITEPWCGDAAHIVPILYLMSQANPNIDFKIQLRDEGSEIDNYLTNGKSKSIPILIVRDDKGQDYFSWGPRPAGAAAVYEHLKQTNADFEAQKIALQGWYNENKALEIQNEVVALLAALKPE